MTASQSPAGLSDALSIYHDLSFFIMPSIVFSFGDTSKEVDLKDVNSPKDLASNMKEVITEEKAKPFYPESFQAAADDYELSEDVI